MPGIQEEITQLYPSLSRQLTSLPVDEASDTRCLSEVGSHVVDLFEAGHSEEIRPAFNLAERLIATGSAVERHAAIVGFLETVQNVASHRHCEAASFTAYLGPQSRVAWTELNEIWKGKTTLAEVVASETGANLRVAWWQFWRKRKKRSARELLQEVENPELRKLLEQITRE
jgi:hypothetical protein